MKDFFNVIKHGLCSFFHRVVRVLSFKKNKTSPIPSPMKVLTGGDTHQPFEIESIHSGLEKDEEAFEPAAQVSDESVYQVFCSFSTENNGEYLVWESGKALLSRHQLHDKPQKSPDGEEQKDPTHD